MCWGARFCVMVMVVVVVSFFLAALVHFGPLTVSAVSEGFVEGLLVAFDGILVVWGGADGGGSAQARFAAGGLVEVLPGLAVVAVEAAVPGARTGGVEGCHSVAIGGGAVAVMFGTLVSERFLYYCRIFFINLFVNVCQNAKPLLRKRKQC